MIDGLSTGTALMNQLVARDLAMSEIDLFNIIGTPATSFLEHDIRELQRLMSRFGGNQDART